MRVRRLSMILGIALVLTGIGGARAQTAQITRRVGHVAVIEADDQILFPVFGDGIGLCPETGVDMDELTKKFYQTYATHQYDFIILYTTFDFLMLPDDKCNETAGGLYVSARNDVAGIGRNIYDGAPSFGSAPGVLRGAVHMGNVNRVSSSGNLRILSQEVGHAWGSFVQFDADPGSAISPSDDLLGRGNSHWSFFLNSATATSSETNPRASGMEGNYWSPEGSSTFRTKTMGQGYSELDLYLMGLLPPSEVDDFWYLDDPSGSTSPSRSPYAGAVVSGTQTFVRIEDVVRVEGARTPAFGESPRIFRQAFVLLTEPGVDATADEIAKVDQYRREWEAFFTRETQNRGAVTTQLRGLRYVNAQDPDSEGYGTLEEPFQTLPEGMDGNISHGTLVLQPGYYSNQGAPLLKPMTLRAVLGPVVIGE